jgi:hypothetical protein
MIKFDKTARLVFDRTTETPEKTEGKSPLRQTSFVSMMMQQNNNSPYQIRQIPEEQFAGIKKQRIAKIKEQLTHN